MSTYLYRLSRWCFARRKLVLFVWLAVVVAIVAAARISGGKTTNTFSIPGTESQQVVSVLKAKAPTASGATTQVVFATDSGSVSQAKTRAAIEHAVTELKKIRHVTSVLDPYQTKAISPDGRVGLATVYYDTSSPEAVDSRTTDQLRPAVKTAQQGSIQVEFTGPVYPAPAQNNSQDVIGIVVALVILVLTFGSLLAGGMPVLTALFGVIISTSAFAALASVIDIASAATTVGTMLGISCGIDYALFILSRHRANLAAGVEPREAAGHAAGTAGSSVVFAGLSVIIALCGLSVVGIPFLTTMGLGAAGAVFIALLVALTLLPAALGFAGTRAGRVSPIPGLRRARAATRTNVDNPVQLQGSRWASWVVRYRVPVLVTGVTALAMMAIPVTGIDLGLPGAGSRPTSDTSRRAYDLTSAHFGAGYNGALTVVVQDVASVTTAQHIAGSLAQVDDVATTRVSRVTNGIALVDVVPKTGPNDQATTDLVHRIRKDRTAIEGSSGTHIMVGGPTAASIDVSSKLADALPVFLVVVSGLAFLLLTFAFRTILVPLTSIIGFLLSISATIGAQVAVFQWGWFANSLGIAKSQTLSFLPVILLAIIFGLSSDYEVFVVSRIKEHFTKTGHAREAVIVGTGQSTRVVTAAALIMTSVFASFMLGPDPTIKAIGFSFALGVLIDAFVVRLTLVPAVMAIVGEKIWHHPQWFARIVPDPDIEGKKLTDKIGQRHPELTTA